MNNHHETLAGSTSFIRYRKKIYWKQNSKGETCEAQQTLPVCSREVNDRQFLNRTHIIYGQQYWMGELHTTTGVCPSKSTACLWGTSISASSTFHSFPLFTPICFMTQDCVSTDFQREISYNNAPCLLLISFC